MKWLFKASGAYYPSIYVFKNGWTTNDRKKQVAIRLEQTRNLRKAVGDESKPIYPYFWYK